MKLKIETLILIYVMIAGATVRTNATELPEVAEPGSGEIQSAKLIYDVADAPTPQCHASTIVETEDGLVASWFG